MDSPFFEVFPNPASGMLTVRAKNTAAYDRRIDLLSLHGQALRTTQLNAGEDSQTLPLAGLPLGLYCLRVQDGPAIRVQKVLVQ